MSLLVSFYACFKSNKESKFVARVVSAMTKGQSSFIVAYCFLDLTLLRDSVAMIARFWRPIFYMSFK